MSSLLSKRAQLPQLPTKWRDADAATEHSDRAEGARLAKRGADAAAAMDSFRRNLAAEASRDLLKLRSDCDGLLRDQTAKRERYQQQLDEELPSKAEANRRQNADELARLRRERGPDSDKHRDAAARAEDAQKSLRQLRADVGSRPLRTHFGHFYLAIMGLLAVAEVPVNRAAFELTFREEPLYSLLLALAVGSVLIFFAHVIGLVLRRWPNRPTAAQVCARAGVIAGLATLAGFGVYHLARMRQAFLRLVETESEGFGDRLREGLQGTAARAAATVSDAPLSVSDWAFIAVNLLLFVFGVAAAFLRHDPHPDYERALRQSRAADRRLAKLEARYAKEVSRENARFETIKQGCEAEMADLRAVVAALSDEADTVRAHVARSREMSAQTIRSRCGNLADGYNGELTPGGRRMIVPSVNEVMGDLRTEHMPHAA